MIPVRDYRQYDSYSFFFYFLTVPCGLQILVLQPGIETAAPAVEAYNPNHWTIKEVLTHTL